jgi:hypothetical protein
MNNEVIIRTTDAGLGYAKITFSDSDRAYYGVFAVDGKFVDLTHESIFNNLKDNEEIVTTLDMLLPTEYGKMAEVVRVKKSLKLLGKVRTMDNYSYHKTGFSSNGGAYSYHTDYLVFELPCGEIGVIRKEWDSSEWSNLRDGTTLSDREPVEWVMFGEHPVAWEVSGERTDTERFWEMEDFDGIFKSLSSYKEFVASCNYTRYLSEEEKYYCEDGLEYETRPVIIDF